MKHVKKKGYIHAANLVKVVAVFSVALLDVPHQEIKRASAEKNLTHSSVIDLSGTVVKLDSDIPQPMTE